MTTRALFDAALDAARNWHDALPAARDFCAWPTDIAWAEHPPHRLPAADLITSDPGFATPDSTSVLRALQDIADHVEWRHTYTVDEVGQRFLDTYGWFELAGPEGHFHSTHARITVGYWGPNLYYPRHQHGPEELYTVVSGHALFRSDGDADATLGPGDTRFHGNHQPHDMRTTDSAILTLVFWRGDGLADTPKITPP